MTIHHYHNYNHYYHHYIYYDYSSSSILSFSIIIVNHDHYCFRHPHCDDYRHNHNRYHAKHNMSLIQLP